MYCDSPSFRLHPLTDSWVCVPPCPVWGKSLTLACPLTIPLLSPQLNLNQHLLHQHLSSSAHSSSTRSLHTHTYRTHTDTNTHTHTHTRTHTNTHTHSHTHTHTHTHTHKCVRASAHLGCEGGGLSGAPSLLWSLGGSVAWACG